MTLLIDESQLPEDLSTEAAVEAAYFSQLQCVSSDLSRNLPVLIECEKDLVPWIFLNLRRRLKDVGLRALFLDGRPNEEGAANPMQAGFMGTMLAQLRDAVRGAVDQRVVVLPHLDLLTTSQGGLTAEAREVIPLLYENPELVWLGFKDPSFPIPKVIQNLFPRHHQILGIPRERLPQLVTQREARKFGRGFNQWSLYKYVSGMNAARLRKVLSNLDGEDYPENPKHAYTQIRQLTASGQLEIPNVDLEKDIGGYAKVKQRLRSEILDILFQKDRQDTAEDIQRLEGLIPKGMIFWGPPGTGKTLFAKAMATAIGAAITIVSGPELKSRWVGESEENLRMIFHQARLSAPSIIVFDELDSFAAARGTYTGSGVEHSMVNQLLTELDGFHSEELVFVVGTTNFVESLDPALLRPGRFEFQLCIPYPNADDRRDILKIYNDSMKLKMTEEALEYTVKRTDEPVEGSIANVYYSGDHLNALCRSLARIRFRENIDQETEPADIERALTEWADRPTVTPLEEKVIATHEAGHAVVALFCQHSRQIERISIQGNAAGALGYVKHKHRDQKYVITRNQLLDELCVLMGGREAELLLCDDLSIGSAGDLEQATHTARALVEQFGMGGASVGVGQFIVSNRSDERPLSEQQTQLIDQQVKVLLEEARLRAETILAEQKDVLISLRDLLLNEKVIDAKTLNSFLSETS